MPISPVAEKKPTEKKHFHFRWEINPHGNKHHFTMKAHLARLAMPRGPCLSGPWDLI